MTVVKTRRRVNGCPRSTRSLGAQPLSSRFVKNLVMNIWTGHTPLSAQVKSEMSEDVFLSGRNPRKAVSLLVNARDDKGTQLGDGGRENEYFCW